ncbi:membrane protein [Moniliophthora roreri]|nr:membrane protein [Moniliophthora roreri]
MLSSFFSFLLGDGDNPDLPPGTPPTLKFEGPWFSTQLFLSCSIGLTSFLIFSYSRTRYPLIFAPRTKLKGFSPHEAHAHQAFFGWILPTIRTSEFTVLQIVGLDAAVLLSFFKMSFYLFSVCSLFAVAILMPINWTHNKEVLDDPDWDPDWPGNDNETDWTAMISSGAFLQTPLLSEVALAPSNSTIPSDGSWLDLFTDATTYLSIHFVFTYLFTIISLYFIYKNYRRFIRTRQLFSLELVHSIPARTILITNLPRHLQGERSLAEYFENMDLAVESVSIVREVGNLKKLLDKRTKALLELENAWVSYVGNPSTVEEYDPENSAVVQSLFDDDDVEHGMTQSQRGRLVVPHRKRPTIRPGWFKPKVDALEYLEKRFREIDELVKRRRRTGKFRPTQTAFVTFEKMSSAQIALQAAHSPNPFQCATYQAPEPRDIVWSNMTPSNNSIRVRDIFVLAALALLFFSWFLPITALASLLSYDEIQRTLPWLARLIDKNEKIQAIVQNSLPSVGMITLNALLPFFLEGKLPMFPMRRIIVSWVEYSLMKKYHLFLLVNVVFIFLVVSTYWALVRDLANFPAKIPEKLAKALQSGKARNFFLSYAILQGLGIMPLQLLNLGVLIPQFLLRMFYTRTPRDYAELNAPPMINYGVVYPQAILMFTITILYSVVQPLIVIFGAIYFGMAYVVYKYKLLFVFYKPYESQGQAWPITYIRLIWGIIIFLVFMTGFFLVSKAFILSSLIVPLLVVTLLWTWYLHRVLTPLSQYVNLSSVYEVERGEESEEVMRLRTGHPVTWSQTNLNRRRYAQNDDTLYVAPEDERTDYSQPPMANWYSGVLNTGKRRYGHPALTGVLPEPWLPLKKGQTLSNSTSNDRERGGGFSRSNGKDPNQAVVLTLRKRPSVHRASRRSLSTVTSNGNTATSGSDYMMDNSAVEESVVSNNPWEDAHSRSPRTSGMRRSDTTTSALNHRMSFDQATGIIMLPDDGAWLATGSDEDTDDDSEEDYGVQQQRRASLGPGSPAPHSIGRSQIEPLLSTESGSGRAMGTEDGASTDSTTSSNTMTASVSPSRTSRYGTYFHHPERRRPTIPGAFPTRSAS